MKKIIEEAMAQDAEFLEIIKDLITNETVQQMKNYRQHYETSCFDHCYLAAYYCYLICKKYNLDYRSATRAAMLHDLFLYDWRVRQPDRKGLHAFTHGKTACDNASRLFDLNEKEKDIILKHMWPVTFFHFPKYKESFVLTFVDKRCALSEAAVQIRKQFYNRKLLHIAYIFLGLFILK